MAHLLGEVSGSPTQSILAQVAPRPLYGMRLVEEVTVVAAGTRVPSVNNAARGKAKATEPRRKERSTMHAEAMVPLSDHYCRTRGQAGRHEILRKGEVGLE